MQPIERRPSPAKAHFVAKSGVGAGNIASRCCAGASGLGLTVWGSLFVPLPLLAGSLILDGPAAIATSIAHFGLASTASTAYTVVLSTLVAFTIWNTLLARHPAGAIAPFTLLVPVVGLLAGWAALGEHPPTAALTGGIVMLAGITTLVLGPRITTRKTPTPRETR